MAANLLARGFPLVVYDVNAAALGPARAQGVRLVTSSREVGAACRLVISMLPAPAHVEEVLAEPEGIIEGMPPGATLIDMSSIDPDTTRTTTVSHRVAATTGVPGRTTLPARQQARYVGLLDRGQAATLALDPGTHRVHLACGRYEANIAAIDADDFPPAPDVTSAHAVTLATRTLKEAIRQVAFAAAPDDSRPVLAGILLRSSGSSLTLAAADGFRLAVRTLDLPAVAPDLALIVPASAMAEVARLLPDGAGHQVTIRASADGQQVRFAFARSELTSRLIDGQFPDYERITPAQVSTTAIVATSDFLRATRVAGVFARDNSHIVRLEVVPTTNGTGSPELAIGRLVVRAASTETGDNEGAIDATITGAPAVRITYLEPEQA